MHLKLYEILNLLSIVWLLFFALFLYVTKRGNRNNNFFLASLLLTNAVFNLFPLIKGYFHTTFPQLIFLLYFAGSTGFLFGPFIYFYTKSLIRKDFTFSVGILIHFVPYFISIIYFIFESKVKFLQLTYLILLYLHISIYIFFAFKILLKFNNQIKNQFSETYKFHITRLFIVLMVFSLLWLLDILTIVQSYFTVFPIEYKLITIYTLFTINLIFAIFIVYDSLSHPELLNLNLSDSATGKYKTSTLNDADKQLYLSKLQIIISDKKPYLNPKINIKELAEISEIPVRALSQIINNSIGMNFYDFINSYRIEYSKNLLINNSEKNILEILFDSGFNTKSAFNSAFKKFTKMTPSEFRKRKY